MWPAELGGNTEHRSDWLEQQNFPFRPGCLARPQTSSFSLSQLAGEGCMMLSGEEGVKEDSDFGNLA